ncbi:MAG: hypothetical protein ACK40X_09570, partial [Armatimonadota bacterium]
RYRVIWRENLPKTLEGYYDHAADLDGDGNDEMVLCVGRKVQVFKIVPNRKPRALKSGSQPVGRVAKMHSET